MEQYFPIVLIALFAVVLFVLPARQRKRMQAQAQAGIALVVGVDRLLDMVRTSVNVTCQLVGVGYVARADGELLGRVTAD